MLSKPRLPPEMVRAQKMPKVCSVKGTGEGIVMKAETEIIAEKRAINMQFLRFSFEVLCFPISSPRRKILTQAANKVK